jgi:hypothetical protein
VPERAGLRDADARPVDSARLAAVIDQACTGLPGADAALVHAETLRALYDGIGAAQLAVAPVLAARSLVEYDPDHSTVAARLLLDGLRTEALSLLAGRRRQVHQAACELEIAYGRDTMPRGILGLDAAMCETYLHFVTHRRCAQLGREPGFAAAENPFGWMSEAIDLGKQKNFFETRVTEYQTGGTLTWE